MIEFKCPELTDRAWAQPLLSAEPTMGCDYNFNNVYLWSRAYQAKIARWADRLLIHVDARLGVSYLYPAGGGPLAAAVDALAADARERGVPLSLVCLTPDQREKLEAACPGRFAFEPDRDSWDYIYDINKLADLTGKKLHGKRNHIHRFDEQFPDWLFEPLTRENVPECLELERAWAAEKHDDSGETMGEESISVVEALYHMDTLEMTGGLIRAGGRAVAFSMGSFTAPGCFDVHFEKAYADVEGAYPVINRELARYIRRLYPGTQWFNREDDLGLEGLRKAKLSYYPDILLEKFTAREV